MHKSDNAVQESSWLQKKLQYQPRTTACEEDKRFKLFKTLTTHSADSFREIDLEEYDLNICENVPELEEIDELISPLIYCAFYGLKDIGKLLLASKKIDVDFETLTNHQTPLLTACICGNYQIVRLLLLAGAEVNKPNMLNHIPLTATIFRLIEDPRSFQNKKICMLIAELLIKHGADVNWVIDKTNGYSLLHYFCSLKLKMNKMQKQINLEVVHFLLRHGANPEQPTLQDCTCKELVLNHCNTEEILPLLQKYSAEWQLRKPPLKKIARIQPDYFKIT